MLLHCWPSLLPRHTAGLCLTVQELNSFKQSLLPKQIQPVPLQKVLPSQVSAFHCSFNCMRFLCPTAPSCLVPPEWQLCHWWQCRNLCELFKEWFVCWPSKNIWPQIESVVSDHRLLPQCHHHLPLLWSWPMSSPSDCCLSYTRAPRKWAAISCREHLLQPSCFYLPWQYFLKSLYLFTPGIQLQTVPACLSPPLHFCWQTGTHHFLSGGSHCSHSQALGLLVFVKTI